MISPHGTLKVFDITRVVVRQGGKGKGRIITCYRCAGCTQHNDITSERSYTCIN